MCLFPFFGFTGSFSGLALRRLLTFAFFVFRRYGLCFRVARIIIAVMLLFRFRRGLFIRRLCCSIRGRCWCWIRAITVVVALCLVLSEKVLTVVNFLWAVGKVTVAPFTSRWAMKFCDQIIPVLRRFPLLIRHHKVRDDQSP